MFPREHRSAFINLHIWTLFKITDQILSPASRDLALRLHLARPLRSWRRDGSLIDTTCTVAALPNALSPEEFNSIETLKTKQPPWINTALPFDTNLPRNSSDTVFYPAPSFAGSRFQRAAGIQPGPASRGPRSLYFYKPLELKLIPKRNPVGKRRDGWE